jgi:threonine 3-dehydrogenase
MKSMRAIAKQKAKPGLALTEAPKQEPDPNDVLIKIKKTSICGTDVHIYN